MRKLLLFSLLFFLLTNCKKEKLLPELSFLEGEWKLESKLKKTNAFTLSEMEKDLVLKIFSDGQIVYSNSKGSFKLRLVKQSLEISETSFVDFYTYKFHKRLKLKVKDKKSKTYFIYFYLQNTDNSRILAMYYLPNIPIMGTNIDATQDYVADPLSYNSMNESKNPYCGTFLKK